MAPLERLSQLLSIDAPASVQETLNGDANLDALLSRVTDAVEARCKRAEELEKGASETRLRLLNLEQALKNLQHKRGEEQGEVARLRESLEGANSQIIDLQEEREGILQDRTHALSTLEKTQGEFEVIKARLERSEMEKEDLLRLLERRQVDIDGLQGQVEGANGRLREIREALLKREVEVNEWQNKANLANRLLEASREEAEKMKKQSEWTSTELEQTLNELGTLRKQKAAELGSLQARLDAAQQEKSRSEEQLEIMRQTLKEKDIKLEDTLRRLHELESRFAHEEAQFMQEMGANVRLIELYRQGLDEANGRLKELEEMLQIARESGKTVDVRIAEANTKTQQRVQQLEAQLEAKEQEIAMVRAHLRSDDSQRSMSDVYGELARVKNELLYCRQENTRLKGCIEDICQDIEARVPVLQMERKENERLKADLNTLSQQLVQLSRSRDELEARGRTSEAERTNLQKANNLLQQQVCDLGRQIQTLLGEMEGVGEEKSTGLDHHDEQVVDAGQIIEERLLVFRNVQELQVRNQELLKVVRELSQQQETLELERLQKVEVEMRAALEANVAELADLREQRQKQASLVESLIRQRDMLREMLNNQDTNGTRGNLEGNNSDINNNTNNNGDNPSASGNLNRVPSINEELDEIKAEFAIFKDEKAATERHLEEVLEKARIELTEAKTRCAQLEAQVRFSSERYDLLKQNYDMERSELANLRQSNAQAMNSIVQHQTQLQQLMGELVSAKDSQHRLSTQSASQRVEVEVLRQSERRLTSEIVSLQEEKERLNQLLANLRAMTVEHEGSEESLKSHLTSQVEFLERELQSARQKIFEEVESHKLAIATADREYRDLLRRHEQLLETNLKIKEEAFMLKSNLTDVSKKATDLETLYQRSEERMARLMKTSSSAENIEDGQGTGTDFNRELAATRAKLEAVQDELRLEREHISNYQGIARTAEQHLADLTRTFDQYKGVSERRLAELEASAAELKAQLEVAQEKTRHAEDDFESYRLRIEQEKHQLEQELAKLQEYANMASSHSIMRKEDVERLQSLVEETRHRYEQEVMAHGKDLESLNTLKKELNEKQQQIIDLHEELSKARENVSLAEQKTSFERERVEQERSDLSKRLAELENQNQILLSQLEAITNKAQARASAVLSSVEGFDDAAAATDSSSSLMEVVKYLRRQKDILQLEHETMSMECRRLKVQCDQQQKALEETRALLAEERSSNQWQSQMANEYRALLEKVEQLNILRESNVTLRHESDQLMAQVKKLEARLHHLQSEAEPREEQLAQLNARVAAISDEMRLIKDDRDNWKKRFDQLLTKHRVDPGESESLRNELSLKEEALGNCNLKITQLESTISQMISSHEQALSEKSAEIESVTAKWNQLIKKHKELLKHSREIISVRDDLSKRVAELEAQSAPSNEEAVSAEKERLNEALSTAEQSLTSLREEMQQKEAKLEKYAEAFKKVTKMKEQFKETQENYQKLQEQLKAAQSSLEDVRRESELRSQAKWSSKVKKLEDEVKLLKEARETKEEINLSDVASQIGPVVPTKRASLEQSESRSPKIPTIEETRSESAEPAPSGDKDAETKDDVPMIADEKMPMTPVNPESQDNGLDADIFDENFDDDAAEGGVMGGIDELEEELMAEMSPSEGEIEAEHQEQEEPESKPTSSSSENKSRVIDLSAIGKRAVVRQPSLLTTQASGSVSKGQTTRQSFRGRGAGQAMRRRRGGSSGGQQQPND